MTYKYRFLFLSGKYRQFQKIDWPSINRLVFVCKGNICRSAYAQAVAQSKGIESISCGIDTVNGEAANLQAIRAAAKRGANLKEHKTTTVQSLTFKQGDLLLAMEAWQLDYLLDYLPDDSVCSLLGLWRRPVLPHIQDPYGSSMQYFDACFQTIEESVSGIAKRINPQSN